MVFGAGCLSGWSGHTPAYLSLPPSWPWSGPCIKSCSPDSGGEDVFIHIKQCNGAESLSEGDKVTYDEEWNDRKGKNAGANCTVIGGGGGGGGGGKDGGGKGW